jgi:hypothetical protein
MTTITETQKTNQAFSKNGKLIKQKDRELYTKRYIEKENSKEKISDEKKLEIIGRKFIEEFKDARYNQNELGNKNDYIVLGKIIANKENVKVPDNLAQFISKHILLKQTPRDISYFEREKMQEEAIFSQSDHSKHYLDKNLGFKEFGDKKFLINLSVGALLKGTNRLNSPDQIIIDLLNKKVYFVELKNTPIKTQKTKKYLTLFLGDNAISKLNRIGVVEDEKKNVKDFLSKTKISSNSKLLTNKEYATFVQGCQIIDGVYGNNIETLFNNKIIKQIVNNFSQIDSIKQLKENTKKFIEYIETLPNEWSLNNLVKEEMKEYFDY